MMTGTKFNLLLPLIFGDFIPHKLTGNYIFLFLYEIMQTIALKLVIVNGWMGDWTLFYIHIFSYSFWGVIRFQTSVDFVLLKKKKTNFEDWILITNSV